MELFDIADVGEWPAGIKKVVCVKDNSPVGGKKELSWNDTEYLEKVNVQDVGIKKSETWTLDRKASVGPCKHRAPLEGPSGITISLPQKSLRSVNQPSGISINISKKCLAKSKSTINSSEHSKEENISEREKGNSDTSTVLGNFFNNVKDNISSAQSKLITFFRS